MAIFYKLESHGGTIAHLRYLVCFKVFKINKLTVNDRFAASGASQKLFLAKMLTNFDSNPDSGEESRYPYRDDSPRLKFGLYENWSLGFYLLWS